MTGKLLELEIISPEKSIFKGLVSKVLLPGGKAPFTVLYNHAPLITSLEAGAVRWNSAEGNGVTPYSADYIFACGADIITGGNHSLRRQEVYEYLDSNPFILRPDNLPDAKYGKG